MPRKTSNNRVPTRLARALSLAPPLIIIYQFFFSLSIRGHFRYRLLSFGY